MESVRPSGRETARAEREDTRIHTECDTHPHPTTTHFVKAKNGQNIKINFTDSCQECFVHSLTSLLPLGLQPGPTWSCLKSIPWALGQGALSVVAERLNFLLPNPEPCQKDMWLISQAGAYPTQRAQLLG